MTCCSHCVDAGDLFTSRTARRELKRYRRKGAMTTTALLIDSIRPRIAPGWTLLDIGGGIGAIQHELIDAGAARSVQVDASRAYLEASRQEAARRGHADHVEHVYGDFVAVADDFAEADIVTLDRVICCYPHMERLVKASAGKARHLYGLVYPREHLAMRLFMKVANAYMRIRRSAFRTYIHSGDAVDALARSMGFERVAHTRTLMWRVVTYARVTGQDA